MPSDGMPGPLSVGRGWGSHGSRALHPREKEGVKAPCRWRPGRRGRGPRASVKGPRYLSGEPPGRWPSDGNRVGGVRGTDGEGTVVRAVTQRGRAGQQPLVRLGGRPRQTGRWPR